MPNPTLTLEQRIVPKLHTLVAPIDTLRPHPKNPNVGRTDLMLESLQRNKQFKPIVVGRGGIILGGNHTYFAAMELGWPDIAAVYVDVDWDSEEGKAITLADNEIGRRSTTEDGLLAELLQSMDQPTLGTGYDDDTLSKLLERIEQPLNFGEDGVQEEREAVTFDIFNQEAVIDEAFAHYRATGMPSFKKTRFAMMQEINKLASLEVDKLVGSGVAHHVADVYHMHRFAVPIAQRQTPLDQFNRDGDLRHALKLTSEKGMINDETFLNTITYVHGAQVASNFRPGFALQLVKRCDFAFTSPPYFGKEMYTDEDTQSWKRYREPESWRVGFLLPTLRLQFRALRSGAYAIMNIADIDISRTGERVVQPLVTWARDCAREVGFEYVTEEKFPLGRVPGQGETLQRFEPVLIWKKP